MPSSLGAAQRTKRCVVPATPPPNIRDRGSGRADRLGRSRVVPDLDLILPSNAVGLDDDITTLPR
jgi:hypothetical protein